MDLGWELGDQDDHVTETVILSCLDYGRATLASSSSLRKTALSAVGSKCHGMTGLWVMQV